MDIGLSHLITVNGEAIKAYWDTFNPNLSLGSEHEILVFAGDIELDNLFGDLSNCLTKQTYLGEFTLAEKTDTLEKFTASYNISLLPRNTGVNVKTFVFTSAGIPWAICKLDKAVAIKKDVKTTFFFASTLSVNNKVDIAKKPWTIEVDKFTIKYAAKVVSMPKDDSAQFVKLSTKGALNENSTDEDIRQALIKEGFYRDTLFIFDKGKIGIQLNAQSNTDISSVKAIFIRVLWNMGIMIYIDSVKWGGNELPNLTLVKGHQLKLVFAINFKELKNEHTI